MPVTHEFSNCPQVVGTIEDAMTNLCQTRITTKSEYATSARGVFAPAFLAFCPAETKDSFGHSALGAGRSFGGVASCVP